MLEFLFAAWTWLSTVPEIGYGIFYGVCGAALANLLIALIAQNQRIATLGHCDNVSGDSYDSLLCMAVLPQVALAITGLSAGFFTALTHNGTELPEKIIFAGWPAWIVLKMTLNGILVYLAGLGTYGVARGIIGIVRGITRGVLRTANGVAGFFRRTAKAVNAWHAKREQEKASSPEYSIEQYRANVKEARRILAGDENIDTAEFNRVAEHFDQLLVDVWRYLRDTKGANPVSASRFELAISTADSLFPDVNLRAYGTKLIELFRNISYEADDDQQKAHKLVEAIMAFGATLPDWAKNERFERLAENSARARDAAQEEYAKLTGNQPDPVLVGTEEHIAEILEAPAEPEQPAPRQAQKRQHA